WSRGRDVPPAALPLSLQAGVAAGEPGDVALAAHRRALEGQTVIYEGTWVGRTYQAWVEPVRDDSGQIAGCLGLALDITERTLAEEALRHAQAALGEQQPAGGAEPVRAQELLRSM